MYRPIPIDEYLVYESNIYSVSPTVSIRRAATRLDSGSYGAQLLGSPTRTIQPPVSKELKDPVLNAVVALANETVRSGYGVLIFSGSRLGCEADARIVSRVVPNADEVDESVAEKRADLLGDLRSLPSGLDPVFAETIPCGVAFHREYLPLLPEVCSLIIQMYVCNIVSRNCNRLLTNVGGLDHRRT